jgi:hypothetical protein
MRIHDEDDDAEDMWPGQHGDSADEDPDPRDISDENFVKCVHCGSYIHAAADMCSYCEMWQTDEKQKPHKPLWFVLTVVICATALSGALAVGIALMYGWWP